MWSLAFAVAFFTLTETAPEPIVGLPCEGCEAVFEGKPIELNSIARIAPQGEPGVAMQIRGQIFDSHGKIRSGVIVYAYQTDATGVYPLAKEHFGAASERHGRLRAWAISDATGFYQFDTIRPAAYQSRDMPEHIHLHVIEPGCSTYYIDDLVFADDVLMTKSQIEMHQRGRGGSGLTTPIMQSGVWRVTRSIHLGKLIPGYIECTPALAN